MPDEASFIARRSAAGLQPASAHRHGHRFEFIQRGFAAVAAAQGAAAATGGSFLEAEERLRNRLPDAVAGGERRPSRRTPPTNDVEEDSPGPAC